MKVRRYSRKCFPTDTSQKKKGWTHPSNYLLNSRRFTLLCQWFKGCLDLQWTQMFCIFIQELFSFRERCGYLLPALWWCWAHRSHKASLLLLFVSQITHDSGLRLETNFVNKDMLYKKSNRRDRFQHAKSNIYIFNGAGMVRSWRYCQGWEVRSQGIYLT